MNYNVTVQTIFEITIDPNDPGVLSESQARALAFQAAINCLDNVGGQVNVSSVSVVNSYIEKEPPLNVNTTFDPNAHM